MIEVKLTGHKNANGCVQVVVVRVLGKHLLLSQQQVRGGPVL